MSTRKISQREARRLQRQVKAFEDRDGLIQRAWAAEYPGGVEIEARSYDSADHPVVKAVAVARALKHAVIVLNDGSTLRYRALPYPQPRRAALAPRREP